MRSRARGSCRTRWRSPPCSPCSPRPGSREQHAGWAFAATTVAMALSVVSIFTELYPKVMVSSTSSAFDLTIHNTASGSYTLKVMTIVVAVFLPVVLAYPAWTYYVFRRRVTSEEAAEPADTLGSNSDRRTGRRARRL